MGAYGTMARWGTGPEAWFTVDPSRLEFIGNSGQIPLQNPGKGLALVECTMRTLLDTFEVRSPNEVEAPPPPRARFASIAIDIEWDEPPPSSWNRAGQRVWTSED